VDAVAARIPTWKGSLLNGAGRATLVQTTLSAIPVHISIGCCLSTWAIEQIDRRRRAFLWAGKEEVSGGRCRITWPIVCAPKDVGGLGIADLKILGFALRLRWEWLRRTRPDSPWALLPSTIEKRVSSMFQSSLFVVVGDGTSAKFWTDNWLPAGAIPSFAPNLFRAVGRRRLGRSVRDALDGRRWVHDITGARTAPVLVEYVRLWRMLGTCSSDLRRLIGSYGVGPRTDSTLCGPRTERISLAGHPWRGHENCGVLRRRLR
jgi:hypothetical protein